MSPDPSNLEKLAVALQHKDCRYVLVGGMAGVLHGSPVVTLDYDLAIVFNIENRANLVEALGPLHPYPNRGNPEAEWDEKSIRPPWTLLQTDVGKVDLIIRLTGIDSFEGLYERSLVGELGGVEIRYASLEDLIAMKKAAGREKDQVHLMYLESLLERRSCES